MYTKTGFGASGVPVYTKTGFGARGRPVYTMTGFGARSKPEGSKHFVISLFCFSMLELVEIDPHVTWVYRRKHLGRFCTDVVSQFGGS